MNHKSVQQPQALVGSGARAGGGGAYLLSGEGADPAQGWRVPVEMHVSETKEAKTVT